MDSFFYFHIINSYEVFDGQNIQIVIDLFTYPNANVLDSMTLERKRAGIRLKMEEYPSGKRFVIPLEILSSTSTTNNTSETCENEGEARSLVLDDKSCETPKVMTGTKYYNFNNDGQLILIPQLLTQPGCEHPSINQNYRGKPYKFFYASGEFFLGKYQNSLVKFCMDNFETKILWKDEPFYIANQPIFVPNPHAKLGDEDDGIIISLITDERVGQKSFLLFLDAKDFTEISRVYFNSFIPRCLQAIFIPQT